MNGLHSAGGGSLSDIQKLVDRGEYLKAYDTARSFEADPGSETRHLMKIQSVILSRLGMPEQAVELLESIKGEGEEQDPELYALLGGNYKRLWLKTGKTRDKRSDENLRLSYRNYTLARESGGDFWCAINAATLAKIMGDGKAAESYSEQAIEECWKSYTKSLTSSSFWIPATLGEACLVKGDYGSARKWYEAARSHVAGNLGWLQSVRSNAEALLEALKPGPETVSQVLDAIPRLRIAMFAGHRLDEKGRTSTRFPEEVSDKVKVRLRKALAGLRLDIGIASAADGSDILFHEAMQGMGRRTVVVLPYPLQNFRRNLIDSVGEAWGNRFDSVIRGADRVELSSTGNFESSKDFLHEFCSDYIMASAMDMAAVNDAELVPVVLWDGKNTGRRGGTSDTVAKLLSRGLKPVQIKMGDPYIQAERRSRADLYPGGDPDGEGGFTAAAFKPILMVFSHHPAGSLESAVSHVTGLIREIETLIEAGAHRVLSAMVCTGGVCMVFRGMGDARAFTRDFDRLSKAAGSCSIVIHAGILVRLHTSLSGREDCFCREVEEITVLGRTLRKPSRICTMQARALSGSEGNRWDTPEYRGVFEMEGGVPIKLFSFSD